MATTFRTHRSLIKTTLIVVNEIRAPKEPFCEPVLDRVHYYVDGNCLSMPPTVFHLCSRPIHLRRFGGQKSEIDCHPAWMMMPRIAAAGRSPMLCTDCPNQSYAERLLEPAPVLPHTAHHPVLGHEELLPAEVAFLEHNEHTPGISKYHPIHQRKQYKNLFSQFQSLERGLCRVSCMAAQSATEIWHNDNQRRISFR